MPIDTRLEPGAAREEVVVRGVRMSAVLVGIGLITIGVTGRAGRLLERGLRARPVSGVFPNGMPYARWGTGPATLLYVPGGPGVGVPTGLRLGLVPLMFRTLARSGYAIWIVGRKRNMPSGHTVADMADDYAELIANEFGGKVDLVLGESFGGMIGFYLAARHPERFDHIAITIAGSKVREEAIGLDQEFAALLSEGRRGDAGALIVRAFYPDLRPVVARILGALLARIFVGDPPPSFRSDVLVEAAAERDYDATGILPSIAVPVLLVAGDRDQYFSRETIEETARLIPDCTLRLYAGKDHLGASTDARLHGDVLEFVRAFAGPTTGDRARPPDPAAVAARPRVAASAAR